MVASKKSAKIFSLVPLDVGPLSPQDPTGLFTPAWDKREKRKLEKSNPDYEFTYKSYNASDHDKRLAILLQYVSRGCSMYSSLRHLKLDFAVVKHATVVRPDFLAALDEAKELSKEAKALACEEELERRAFEGTTKHTYDKDGYLLKTEIQQNDKLLEKLLQVNDPDTYAPPSKSPGFSLGNNNVLIGGAEFTETLQEILVRNRHEPLSPPVKKEIPLYVETDSPSD